MLRYLILVFNVLLFNSQVLSQQFELVTETAGLLSAKKINGAAVADFDLDGDLDIYFVAHSVYDPDDEITWSRLYANNGDNTFSDVTHSAGLHDTTISPMRHPYGSQYSATWGDYNNDGYPDLFVSKLGLNSLYLNLGNATFNDVTDELGVAGNQVDVNTSAVWWDYDRDGDLDLYVCNWDRPSQGFIPDDTVADRSIYPNTMYENQDSIFVDVTETSALGDTGRTWAALPMDINNDGLLDLYVVNDQFDLRHPNGFGRNNVYINNGDKTFRMPDTDLGLGHTGSGMGVTVGDVNRDGFFDIYVTNITPDAWHHNWVQRNPLYINSGNGTFEDQGEAYGVDIAGWGWGTLFFDCDNDGDDDLYVAAGFSSINAQIADFNYFFLNEQPSNIQFKNISLESGCRGWADSRGLVTFDFDDDGDLDILVPNINLQQQGRRTAFEPSLYENKNNTGNWLKVDLIGTTSNRCGFGAAIEVVADSVSYHRYHSGITFLGQNIQPEHFGLADAQAVQKVIVKWPSGKRDEVSDVQINRTLVVVEGEHEVDTPDGPSNPDTFVENFTLRGGYPNPFNAGTRIEFTIPGPGQVEIEIFNVVGQRIRRLKQDFSTSGVHHIFWDGKASSGLPVPSGVYIYRAINEGIRKSGKVAFMK